MRSREESEPKRRETAQPSDAAPAPVAEMNRSFSGSMPELYDRFLVPLQFEPFAQDLAARLGKLTSGHLLEVAAGTGVVTRALARSLPRAVHITATDLNPAMLDQAKKHAGVQRVVWREADAMALKLRTVRYGLARGVEHIKTWNDVNNQPMLAINEAMGFVRQPAWITYEKDLSASSQSRPAS